MFKLDLEKAEEPEIKLPISIGLSKNQESSKKHLLYWLCQNLWLCGSSQTMENSERDGHTRPSDVPLEKSVCRSGSNSQNWAWSKDWFQIGKGVVKAVYCHPAYLTYMQSTSWETGLDETQVGKKHTAGRNINNLRYADDTTLRAEIKELKSLLMKEWKIWLKAPHSEN